MFKKLILVQGILLALQTLLYFGCEFFQSKIHDVKRPVDDKIPFLPWTVLPYCFWFPMIVFYPLIVFRTDPHSYCGYLTTMVMEIVLSIVCYLIYPTSFQRPVPPDGFWGKFMKFVYHSSYRGLNCAPSLHCSSCFLVICVSFTCAGMSLWVRGFTVSIASMIVLSTLTTKQHTLIDVLTAVPLFLISRILGNLLTIRFFTPVLKFVGK
jgi:hypothetical protein